MMKIARLSRVLAEIRRRPEMHLGRLDLEDLDTFLAGYHKALFDHGLDEGEDPPGEFGRFIARRYGWPMDSGPLAAIRLHSTSPQEAWKRFWELLDDFQQTPARGES